MGQEIEIEFKTLIDEHTFYKLLETLPFPNKPVVQINHYFDTKHMSLKKHKSALRIREKDNSYTLTLKQPQTRSVLETHDLLTYQEYVSWIKGHPIAKPYNGELLNNMNIQHEDLVYYGFLKTKRYAFHQDELEFVLDESSYLNQHDFELELEAKSYDTGLAAFEKLLQQHDIIKQAPITKIARFFQALENET